MGGTAEKQMQTSQERKKPHPWREGPASPQVGTGPQGYVVALALVAVSNAACFRFSSESHSEAIEANFKIYKWFLSSRLESGVCLSYKTPPYSGRITPGLQVEESSTPLYWENTLVLSRARGQLGWPLELRRLEVLRRGGWGWGELSPAW